MNKSGRDGQLRRFLLFLCAADWTRRQPNCSRACTEAGHALDRDQVEKAFRRFKQLADLGAPVTLTDVFQEVGA